MPDFARDRIGGRHGQYIGKPLFVGDETTRHFMEDQWASMPIPTSPADWTLMGWFVWESGNGPLICADKPDWDWGWLYNHDGSCAYRIGGTERVSDVATSDLMDGGWHFVSVSKEGTEAALWIDDRTRDRWTNLPLRADLSDVVVMKHAIGYAKHIALAQVRVPDENLAKMWQIGSAEFG